VPTNPNAVVCAACGHEQTAMDHCDRCRSVSLVLVSAVREALGDDWRSSFVPQSVLRIVLQFAHVTCDQVIVDINLPLPDPPTEGAEAMATRVCPACPICKLPMSYVGFSFDKEPA